VGRPVGKRLLEGPRNRWEDIDKRVFKKWDRGAWTGLL
jgi:hypothetical protein